MRSVDVPRYPFSELVGMDKSGRGEAIIAITAIRQKDAEVAQWLLAEKDYLLDLERILHQDQWREHRRYKNSLVHTLRWLVAEARWIAQESEKARIKPFCGTAVAIVTFPWGALEVRGDG